MEIKQELAHYPKHVNRVQPGSISRTPVKPPATYVMRENTNQELDKQHALIAQPGDMEQNQEPLAHRSVNAVRKVLISHIPAVTPVILARPESINLCLVKDRVSIVGQELRVV